MNAVSVPLVVAAVAFFFPASHNLKKYVKPRLPLHCSPFPHVSFNAILLPFLTCPSPQHPVIRNKVRHDWPARPPPLPPASAPR